MRWILIVLALTGLCQANPETLITADFENADLVYAIKVCIRQVGRNVFVAPSVEGAVTVQLRSVTLDEAMEQILPDGFGYKLLADERTVVVGPGELLEEMASWT